jgi:2-keto-4-pentenoate hydratase
MMNEVEIADASAALAAARTGHDIAGLAPGPQTMAEAEAIQMATLAALGVRRGGWKLGRSQDVIFSAPMPEGPVDEEEPVLTLPAGTRIELEIALRFREAPPSAPLTIAALPELADLVVLLEFVRARFSSPTPGFDRIADCISNERVVAVTAAGPWSSDILEDVPLVELFQDGAQIATHQGAHPAAPLDRCSPRGMRAVNGRAWRLRRGRSSRWAASPACCRCRPKGRTTSAGSLACRLFAATSGRSTRRQRDTPPRASGILQPADGVAAWDNRSRPWRSSSHRRGGTRYRRRCAGTPGWCCSIRWA